MENILPRDYLDMKRVMDVNLSGSRVVWVEKSADPANREYTSRIKILDNDGSIRQYTSGLKRDFYPRFSPDGSKLAFLSTRAGKPQLFLLDTSGGEGIKITSQKHGVLGFSWSPNSQKIAFISPVDPHKEKEEIDKPTTKFEKEQKEARDEEEERKLSDPRVITKLTYRRGTSYDNPNLYKHIFVVDTDLKEIERISDGEYDHAVPQFVSDSQLISVSNREKPKDLNPIASLVKFDINETSTGEILTKVESEWIENPVADDTGLIFINSFGDKPFGGQITKWARYYNGQTELINTELDRGINQIRIIDEKTVLVTVEDAGIIDVRKYDIERKEFTKLFDINVSVIDFDAVSTDEIYFTGTDPNHVWAIWRWSASEGLELIEDPNHSLFSDKKIIVPEEHWFENPDGIKYQGWFFDAREKNDEQAPLVLSIHGGPHIMWTNAATMWHEWQCLLSEGYSILAVNPIGSQGYGEEVSQLILGEWGVDDARDLLSTIDHFSDRVDEEKLYVTGGSYAGFQTANIISKTDRFKAACSQRGVYDHITFGLTTDIPLFSKWEMMGTPWDNLDQFWELSPISRVKKINTPLLIIHAENDYRVSISQAEELFAALKLHEKEAVMVRYPRDGHELSRSGEPNHVVDRLQRMIDWFNSHP